MADTPRKGFYSRFSKEELRKAYDQMSIFSDVIASVFFRDKATTQHIIRAVIEKDDLDVVKVKTQNSIENAFGHSVRFDVLATDSEGNFYNIEIQNAANDNLLARADFYGASIKMRHFKKCKSYSEVPRVYVIFFVKDGRYCDNKLVNHYFIKDDANRDLGIGTRIYFVNGSLHDDSPVGKISHDFSCTDASEMKDEVVAKQFATVKQQELKTMDTFTQRVFEEGLKSGEELGREDGEKRGEKRGREEGEKRGRIKGKLEQLMEITRRIMSNEKKSLEDAMRYLQLSDSEKSLVRGAMA